MAIAFRQFTQIAAGGSSGASTVTAPALPTGTVAGDMVILAVIVKYASVGINDPSGWTAPATSQTNNTGLTDSGNDAGNIRAALYFREYDGVWAMPSLTLTAAADVTMRGAISYSKGASEAWVTPVCATAADNSAGAAGVDPIASGTTISFATGDFFGSFCGQNGDVGTFSAHTATVAGVTFGTQNARLAAASTTGTDLRGHSVDKPYSSGTASAGPDGAMTLTGGGASTAGVFVFYRLRVAPLVTAVLAAPMGALTGTATATYRKVAVLAAPMGALAGTITAGVEHPAVLASALGGLSATAAAVPEHPAVLAAPLGGLSATGAATPKHGVVLAAGLGGLTAAITATPEHPAVLAAPLGALTATASATVTGGTNTVTAVLSAPLGSLTGTATATPEHPVTAVAACGGLAATAAATVRHSALGAAPLGELVATASATVTTPPVVDAVLVADLGQLVAMANAGPPPPPIASVGFARFDVPSPAWGEVISWVDYLNEPMWEDFYI